MNEMQNAITGQRIKEARKKRNLSQRELAEMLGKSLRTIQKYESGEIEVNNLTIQMLALALDVTPFYLSGYSADSVRLENLGDICAFFFELENKAEISYDVHVDFDREKDNVTATVSFQSGVSPETGEFSPTYMICSFLASLAKRREAGATDASSDEYKKWMESMFALYSRVGLTDKMPEAPAESVRQP